MSGFLSVCIDSNVFISAIAFGGVPLKILDRALLREFHLVLGPPILDEVRANLVNKLGLSSTKVDTILADFVEISSIFVPSGAEEFIKHKKDNLVLEIALIANCDILVTGDKKDLLPLSPFRGLVIESPSNFLKRFQI